VWSDTTDSLHQGIHSTSDHHHENPDSPSTEEIDSKSAEDHLTSFISDLPDSARSPPSQHRDTMTSSTKVTRSVGYHEETGRTPAGVTIRIKESTIPNEGRSTGIF
jgi:hypothetical protein